MRLFFASEKESVEALRNVSTWKGAVTPGGPYPYHDVVDAMLKNQKKLVEMHDEVFSSQLPDLQKTHIVLPDITF